MNRKQTFKIVVIIFTLLILTHKFDYFERPIIMMDRNKVWNLREREDSSNKTYAEILINEIPIYKAVVESFSLYNEYSPDYTLTSIKESKELNGEYKVIAMYTSIKTQKKISIILTVFMSAKEAQLEWIDSLEGYSAGVVPVSERNGITVGDIAVAITEKDICYVRGNVMVDLTALSGNSVVEVAKEIDNQILIALGDAKKRSDRLAS